MEFSSEICSLFISRRLGGKILSVNFSPLKKKACSFNCIYCALGKTINHKSTFSEDECYRYNFVKNELKRSFEHFKNSDPDIVAINVAGTGEPTLYYFFSKAAKDLLELRDKYFPELKISIFTNMSGNYDKEFYEVINKFDTIYCKLDAGTDEEIKRINQPAQGISLNKIITNMEKLDHINLSVAVFQYNLEYIQSREFINLIYKLKPVRISLYELDRPKQLSGNKTISFRIDADKLIQVKKYIEKNCNIPVDMIYKDKSRGKHDLADKMED